MRDFWAAPIVGDKLQYSHNSNVEFIVTEVNEWHYIYILTNYGNKYFESKHSLSRWKSLKNIWLPILTPTTNEIWAEAF